MFSDVYGTSPTPTTPFCEMTGYSRTDLPLRWDKMTPARMVAVESPVATKIRRDGTVTPWEKEYIRKDGTRVPVLIGGALLDRDGVELRLLRPRSDAAQERRGTGPRRRTAARTRLAAERDGRAAGRHGPRNPSAAGRHRQLRQRQPEAAEEGQLTVGALKDRLREIAAESMRVAEVLRRIREFIRRREPDRKLVNLNTIVMDALQFTRLERREHRVAVMVRPDRDLPPVQADRVQITQVLVNLLSNAIHAVSNPRSSLPRS